MRDTIMLGEIRVEPSLNEIAGRRVEPRTMDVLVYLIENAPRVVSQHDLLIWVWGNDTINDNVVHRTISKLRRALGDDAHQPRVLETVPRRGYRLISTATAEAEPSPPLPNAGPVPRLPARAYHALALLPFAVSGDRSSAKTLGHAFCEELADVLSATNWDIVAPETSVAAWHESTDPRALGFSLRAAYLLTARASASKREIAIYPRLLDCIEGRQLWSGRWRGSYEELKSNQTSLVVALAQAVLGRAARVELARAQTESSDDPSPWSLVYRAGNFGDHEERLSLLLRALELDPEFGPAHALLADFYARPRGGVLSEAQRAEFQALGRYHLEAALRLAPDDYEVLRECAMVARYLGELELQLRLARRAFEISPLGADVLGIALVNAGDESEGLRLLVGAAEEPWKLWGGGAPFWMSGSQPLIRLAHAYCRVGRFSESLRTCERLLAVRPQDKGTMLLKLNVLAHLGRENDARRALPLVAAAFPGWGISEFVVYYREMAGAADSTDMPKWLHNYTGGLSRIIIGRL